MKVYCIVDSASDLLTDTLFSTRERAERELRDFRDFGDENAYLALLDVSEQEYFKLLSAEAGEDDDEDALLRGDDSEEK
jgi:hypothetical protein